MDLFYFTGIFQNSNTLSHSAGQQREEMRLAENIIVQFLSTVTVKNPLNYDDQFKRHAVVKVYVVCMIK